MGNLAIQDIAETGLEPAFVAATDAPGDEFVNDDRTFLVVKNGDASPHTVTIAVQRANFSLPNFGTVVFAALVVVVGATEERWIKIPKGPYNDGNGKAQITYDAITTVTVAAIKMPSG